MEDSGFQRYECEWWHYSLRDEPYPDTYFDFPISADPARGHLNVVSLRDWASLVGGEPIWRLDRGSRGGDFVDIYTPSTGACGEEVRDRLQRLPR